jgi:hypothetical protein
VSSRKFHASTCFGELGRAKETRLCFNGSDEDETVDEAGKGALNENVEDDGGLNLLDSFVGEESPVGDMAMVTDEVMVK